MSAPRRCSPPSAIRRISPESALSSPLRNYHENWTYQGGAFEQWFNESWTSGLAQDTLNRAIHDDTNAVDGQHSFCRCSNIRFSTCISIPAPRQTRRLAPYFLDWLAHPTYDGYWKQWSIEENYANIQVPALTIAAWYDIFQGGSLRNYVGLKAHAGNEAARNGQRLLVTIGGHAANGQKIGDVDFGPAAADYDENAITFEWYDYLFQGKQNEFATTSPCKIFVMGENKWRNEDAWPLERAKETSYFLQSSGKANSAAGDGSLFRPAEAQQSEAADTFVYDPANPVPTVGGPLCCDPDHLPPGPRDQKDVESAPGCARLLHAAARCRRRSHRPRHARSLCEIIGGRYGLHRQAGRRMAQRLRAESHRRHYSRQLSASRPRLPLPSSPARSTSTRSISGQPATSFSRAIAFASRFQAATFRASIAT